MDGWQQRNREQAQTASSLRKWKVKWGKTVQAAYKEDSFTERESENK